MKKPALRKNRSTRRQFVETRWTKSSKNIGEYIFRRLSLDQSNKELLQIRPRHCMSKLIVSSKEIESYVADFLAILAQRNKIINDNTIDNDIKISNHEEYVISESIGHS